MPLDVPVTATATATATAIPPPDRPEGGAVRIPHDGAAVPHARHAVVSDLERDHLPAGVVDDIAIVVSELLGNAVRHGAPLTSGEVLLRWRVEPEGVELEVVDGGGAGLGGAPRARQTVPADATGGRGLCIVDALAARWGSRVDGVGRRTVWATVATLVASPVALVALPLGGL